MIKIKNLTLKNFLSIGQVTQAVDFDRNDLTLILGENLDLGGDGAKNGTGKTTILQGISYALFGIAINNIKKDNLINRTNAKAMVATIEFESNGVAYKIVRGRKPNILKYYINDTEQETSEDEAQGDSRETQHAIQTVLGMSPEMFRQIVALNTYNEPFLALKAADQREVIEQLLGITLLSEKAESIKELNKAVKESIKEEDYRIKGVDESNKRIKEQIESLKRRRELWQKKYDSDVAYLASQYEDLLKIDITAEILAHKNLQIWNEQRKQAEARRQLVLRHQQWEDKKSADTTALLNQLVVLNQVDITAELQAHLDLASYTERSRSITELKRWIASCETAERHETAIVKRLKLEIESLEDHKCHACGQDVHDDAHETTLANKRKELQEAALQALATNTQVIEHMDALKALGELGAKPTTHYRTESEAVKHNSELDRISNLIAEKDAEVNPYTEQLAELPEITLGNTPITHYRTEAEAVKHQNMIVNIEQQIANKALETDPYTEQITDMETTAIQEISFDAMNKLTRQLQHQEYLLDLLTNKKSFVRKKIIDQNLAYLNSRLTHYLDKMGLPHQVVFQNDLTVEITEFGRDLDYGNLSRGESTRLTLSLSFAFRDVWESLYQPINMLFVDELLDNGLDTIGVENAIGLLKEMTRRSDKSVWLVSHRDELLSRVNSILKVVKEGGYTSYNSIADHME